MIIENISSELSQKLWELLPIAVFITDEYGNVLYMNKATERLLKVKKGMDYNAGDFYKNPSRRIELLSLLRLQKRIENFNVELIDYYGNEIYCSVYIYLHQVNGKNILLSFLIDKTKEKEIEKALQDYSKNLEEMIEKQTEELKKHVEILERNQKILKSKQEFEKLYNKVIRIFNTYLDKELLLKNLIKVLSHDFNILMSAVYLYDEWERVLVKTCHRGINSLPEKIKMGETLIGIAAQNKEKIYLKSDENNFFKIDTGLGVIQTSSLLFIPIIYQSMLYGVMVLALIKPIKERETEYFSNIASQLAIALHNIKQYESIKRLADELREKTELIIQKNEELERASKLKSQFLANMSHELRTPLNAIIGFSEVLLEGTFGKLNEKQKKYTENILKAGKHLLALINDILDLSKVEAGKMELVWDKIDVVSLIETSKMMITEKAKKHNIELITEIDPNIKSFYADERKLKQILFNLLSNAAKFTPDGGKIWIRAKLENNNVIFEVEDTGIGIPKEKQEVIFEEFRQVDGSTARKYGGTGLGLALCKKLVELHGGKITVESEVNKGSKFTVYIPYQTKKPQKEKEEVFLYEPQLSSKELNDKVKILIIEDDPIAREKLKKLLEEQDFEVYEHDEGNNAIQKMLLIKPDIVILDIILPGKDGWEILKEKKKHKELKDIKVIITSIVDEIQKGFFCGAVEYFVKPLDEKEVLKSINNIRQFINKSKKGKILVVDDEPESIELIRARLENLNVEVVGKYSGKEALELLQKEKFDLVIVDLIMPEMSGFELISKIKEIPECDNIPIIVLTAKELTEEEKKRLSKQIAYLSYKYDFKKTKFIEEIHKLLKTKK